MNEVEAVPLFRRETVDVPICFMIASTMNMHDSVIGTTD